MEISSDMIIKALRIYYNKNRYAFFPELRIGTGYGKNAEQRLDAWIMDLYPSDHLKRITIEIKTSRQDFLNELKKPLKRRYGLLFSNEFYFVTPKDLVKDVEIPIECGLMEMEPCPITSYNPSGLTFKTKVKAPFREMGRPNWLFIASICRRIQEAEIRKLESQHA